VDKREKDYLAIHCGAQAHAERLLRELQRPDAGELLKESLLFGLDHARTKIARWQTITTASVRPRRSAISAQLLTPPIYHNMRSAAQHALVARFN
jgi:hypothetical protein